MNYVPGPSSQQHQPQSHHLAANTMSYPHPNLNPNPNLNIYSNPAASSLPNPNTFNPTMMPNNPTIMPINPSMPPNSSPYSIPPNPRLYPNQPNPNLLPSQSTYRSPNVFPIQDVRPNPAVTTQNVLHNPNDYPNPNGLPHAARFPDPNALPVSVPDPISVPSAETLPASSSVPEHLPTSAPPETMPTISSAPPEIVPSSTAAPETMPSLTPGHETEPATSAGHETEPATSAGHETEPATSAGHETEPASSAAHETVPATSAGHETEPATIAGHETEPATSAGHETEPATSADLKTEPGTGHETEPTSSAAHETEPATSAAHETEPEPATSATPESSPNSSSTPTPDTLPNPNRSLAGKLAENIRRSKRKRTLPKPLEETITEFKVESPATVPARPTKKAKTKSVRTSAPMESDCPKEYLIENAYTDRLRFNNDVAKVVYKDDFARLSTKEEFQKYLSQQQKWRWEIYNIVTTLDTRVHNLVANRNSGIAQNVIRYSSVPVNCKSDDVRRCEKTAKELEKMSLRIETTKSDMVTRRSLLFDDEDGPVAGEIDFLDEMVEKIENLKTNVDSFTSKVTDTLQNICRRFTTESVEAAEERRQKRRKKENLKKKRKSLERQVEKKLIDALLRLTNKEVAERVLTGGEGAKISSDEVNSKELKAMTSADDITALHTILVREYLDKNASKLIKDKLAKCK